MPSPTFYAEPTRSAVESAHKKTRIHNTKQGSDITSTTHQQLNYYGNIAGARQSADRNIIYKIFLGRCVIHHEERQFLCVAWLLESELLFRQVLLLSVLCYISVQPVDASLRANTRKKRTMRRFVMTNKPGNEQQHGTQ
jgi:hypothetical protein